MIGDSHFLRKRIVEVDAAVVGIGKPRWVTIGHEEATDDKAQEKMAEHRFDVLPVEKSHGVQEYYQTKQWNDFGSVQRKQVRYEDTLPLRTPIRDVIRAFSADERTFYFLEHEGRVAGLISLANLNCRQVRVFLFGLVGELEIRLGRLLRHHFDDEEALLPVISPGTQSRYEDAKTEGVEVNITEHFNFRDYIHAVDKKGLQTELGFTGNASDDPKSRCNSALWKVNDLRNDVAHQKSLIKERASVDTLWENVEEIERLLFNLRQWEQVRDLHPDTRSIA
jgi:hypothetical protein